jgi:hypothetical protein
VLLAIYDGREIQIREGVTRGIIADAPTGSPVFGFDDIFIPEEEIEAAKREERKARTYAQMSLDEKNETSARARALQKLREIPFTVGHYIYELQEPDDVQLESIDKEFLAQHPDALKFAFSTAATNHIEPNADLKVTEFKPFHEIKHKGGAVVQYKIDDSADQGFVVLPSIDLKRDSEGNPVRLDVDIAGNPILKQMGPGQVEMALASRALEFIEMHSPEMHQLIRDLQSGKIKHVPRTNTRSKTLEKMLGMKVKTDKKGRHKIVQPATKVFATGDTAYNRESSLKENRSRRKTRKYGLVQNTRWGPMSAVGLGGMPPVGGSKDMLVLGAMGYSQTWISRNGVKAGDFEAQLQQFKESKTLVESFGLDKDIEELVVSRIGLTVGCENPEKIADQVAQFQEAGGKSVRIYTTNPDKRIVETAKAIRSRVTKDFLIAVGPVTDAKQARALREQADVGMFLIGHGAGENCTSLEGGGSPNAFEILYELYLDKDFNDRLLALEGGVGQNYGQLAEMVDVFSLNQKALGGIEATGGLYAKHSKLKKPCSPYHGSASPGTQLVEAYVNPEVGEIRLNPAGTLETNEGKPNYFEKPDWMHSSADAIRRQREVMARALADQQSNSIYDIRRRTKKRGRQNIVSITGAAGEAAKSHRRAA